MKKKDLEKILAKLGFSYIGGTKHNKWTDCVHTEMVPRHTEVNEYTPKGIIKNATLAAAKRKGK